MVYLWAQLGSLLSIIMTCIYNSNWTKKENSGNRFRYKYALSCTLNRSHQFLVENIVFCINIPWKYLFGNDDLVTLYYHYSFNIDDGYLIATNAI